MASEEALQVVRPIVQRYIAALQRAHVHPQRVIVYGSAAAGAAHADSDIDVAVVSDDLSGDRLEDQLRLMELRWPVDLRIEPHPFRPEDFTRDDPCVQEIMDSGVEIT